MKYCKNIKKTKGFTLVELMVGFVVSMFVVLGMLALYKTTVKVVVPSQLAANIEGQISTGIITADKLLQGAGNKKGDTAVTASVYLKDLLMISGASLAGNTLSGTASTATPTTSGTNGNAVLWVTNTGGTYTLNGLFAPTVGGIKFITNSVGASVPNLSTSWSSASWNSQDVIVPPSPSIPNSPNVSKTTFKLSSTGTSKCLPFSGTSSSFTAGGVYVLDVNVTGYAGNEKTITSSTCLFNFQ